MGGEPEGLGLSPWLCPPPALLSFPGTLPLSSLCKGTGKVPTALPTAGTLGERPPNSAPRRPHPGDAGDHP